jgi:hypothetical protein
VLVLRVRLLRLLVVLLRVEAGWFASADDIRVVRGPGLSLLLGYGLTEDRCVARNLARQPRLEAVVGARGRRLALRTCV